MSRAKNLIIIGAGGFGREVFWQIGQKSEYNILGFVDDNPELSVLGNIDWLMKYPGEIYVAICIANPKIRQDIYNKLKNHAHIKFPSLIMDGVRASETVSLGIGCIICCDVLLTVNITLGDFVIINPRCNIAHDTILGDFATLYYNVNIAGAVQIGGGSEIGTGAVVIQNKTIGENTIIGAGAVVIKDIPADCTAVGVPARVLL